MEAKYQKLETNQKVLKLIIAMDAHKFKIATKQTKGLEKENVDLNVNYTPKQTI